MSDRSPADAAAAAHSSRPHSLVTSKSGFADSHSPSSSPLSSSTPRILHSRSAAASFSLSPSSSSLLSSPPSHYLPSLLAFFSLWIPALPPAVLSSLSLSASSSFTLHSLSTLPLAHVLSHLSPAFFPSPSSSFSSFLSCLTAALEDRAGGVVDLSYLRPASAAASESDAYSLLSLSLLCCVYGARREEVVEAIMGLAEERQAVLMAVINDWENRLGLQDDDATAASAAAAAAATGPDSRSPSPRQSPPQSGALPSQPLQPPFLQLQQPSAASRAAEDGHDAVGATEYKELNAKLTSQLRESQQETESLRAELRLQQRRMLERENALRADLLAEQTAQMAAEQSAKQERAVNDQRLRNELALKQVRLLETQLQTTREELLQSTTRLQAVQREKDRGDKGRAEREEELRELRDALSLSQQKLEEFAMVRQQLSRAHQRLELVSELKEQYAMLEGECMDKTERLQQMEEELGGLTLLRQREREARDRLRVKEVEAEDAKARADRLEEQTAELRAELKAIKAEQRRWREEQRDWQDRDTASRALALSLSSDSSPPALATLQQQLTEARRDSADDSTRTVRALRDQLEQQEEAAATLREREREAARRAAQAEEESRELVALVQRLEAMVVKLRSRWEAGRQSVRRMQARCREYDAMLQEMDRRQAEEDLMQLRERAVMSSAVYGLGEELMRRLIMDQHGLADDGIDKTADSDGRDAER